MSVIGDSQRWRAALANVYDLIRDAIWRVWPECKARVSDAEPAKSHSKKTLARQRREDPITRNLIVRLRRDLALRESPIGWIASQWELLPQDPEPESDPIGYLDVSILFYAGSHKLCLALECKRLNVRRPGKGRATLAREYVHDGMMRFIKGQYSAQSARWRHARLRYGR